ncbi:response regulator [Campylobacter sp. RM12327]|uniref:response regulator n=1 Tax=Campylobacter sputorum TaxID=206 RepID=UPI000B771002|nr:MULTISPECIES: response regulator [Campylobacter]ASM39998.1 receiver domain protein [Campylobacter sputorum]MBE7357649.1 response regulator [Campylobacter sp. RM11302]MBF6669295.1 response regulator [Campylobacter sp. RM12327]MBF6674563.1 response regulator [Campylobacter sp. RM13538]MBF6676668.1 response regulator [Campylobacter sp. RM12321]
MKVLIVENEIYLAQSIASKLSKFGFDCTILENENEYNKNEFFDVILLSTSFSNKKFEQIIVENRDSIIIVMITYISNDTILRPIELGAHDYIQKPFIMEELIRKIKYFINYHKLKMLNTTYKNYFKNNLISPYLKEHELKKLKLPVLIRSIKTQNSDSFALFYTINLDIAFEQIDLKNNNSLEKLKSRIGKNLLYLINFQSLKDKEKMEVLEICSKKQVIISTTNLLEKADCQIIDIPVEDSNFDINEILSIDDYTKLAISKYQNKYSDTDLAKKLGMSRKSLWEKRKKYGIQK